MDTPGPLERYYSMHQPPVLAAVPVVVRNDSPTHIESWEALRRAAGCSDFLYVADSKLCAREPMDHIDRRGGRFVCVMPRTRLEDGEFREWIQTHEPDWERVRDERNPHRRHSPRDRWWGLHAPLPSREAWPVGPRRAERATPGEPAAREPIARAGEELSALNAKLAGPRARRRKRAKLEQHIKGILGEHHR